MKIGVRLKYKACQAGLLLQRKTTAGSQAEPVLFKFPRVEVAHLNFS